MKLFGNVNIMGIKEVIFTTKLNDCIGKNIIMTLRVFQFSPGLNMWVPDTGSKEMSVIQMTKSLKSLAQNPKVELTFNDGAMYISILNPNKL